MNASPPLHPVTIVVPVYGDLPSLLACVDSLKRNVDRSVHRVLLLNDVGPQADEIEAALLNTISGEPGFDYHRNPQNLGFVGSCNRAVYELDATDNDILLLNSDTVTTPGFLDELSAVLHASPQHGAVCARSNNATIASLPFKLRDPSVGRTVQRTAAVHAELKDVLPPFSVSPVAMGFCILIRRELIREYGLFDEIFAPGYGEENDFCLRIRQHGFLSLIAHRALVFHIGGQSFVGARREGLRSAHEKVLVSRYPFYTDAVRQYINQERDPVDVFADAMLPGDDIVRVLIDIDVAPIGRLSEQQRGILAAAVSATGPKATFTVTVPDRIAGRVARRFRALRVVRHSRLDGQWDVALVSGVELLPPRLARLNRTSLRWVLADSSNADAAAFADAILQPAEEPAEVLRELLEQWARSPVNVVRLRARWAAVTTYPDHMLGTVEPRERLIVRLARRAELIAPRPVGWAKAMLRKALGRA